MHRAPRRCGNVSTTGCKEDAPAEKNQLKKTRDELQVGTQLIARKKSFSFFSEFFVVAADSANTQFV